MSIRKQKEELYNELSWIPRYFASRMFDLNKIHLTKQDVEQEFNLVLWKTIEFYYSLIKEGKKPKIDVRRYCYTAIQNEKISYIRKIHRHKRNISYTSLSTHDVLNDQNFADLVEVKLSEQNKLIVDGIDILDFPYKEEYKRIFKDLLIGFTIKELSEIYNINESTIKTNIRKMKGIIRKNYSEIFSDLSNLFKEKTLSIFKEEYEESDDSNLPVLSPKERKAKFSNTGSSKKSFNLNKYSKYFKSTKRS